MELDELTKELCDVAGERKSVSWPEAMSLIRRSRDAIQYLQLVVIDLDRPCSFCGDDGIHGGGESDG